MGFTDIARACGPVLIPRSVRPPPQHPQCPLLASPLPSPKQLQVYSQNLLTHTELHLDFASESKCGICHSECGLSLLAQ